VLAAPLATVKAAVAARLRRRLASLTVNIGLARGTAAVHPALAARERAVWAVRYSVFHDLGAIASVLAAVRPAFALEVRKLGALNSICNDFALLLVAATVLAAFAFALAARFASWVVALLFFLVRVRKWKWKDASLDK
jgi:hypothetical protein